MGCIRAQCPGAGDFIFGLDLTADMVLAAAAEEKAGEEDREVVYFEQCKALPRPDSYLNCHQSSHSVSTSNGKTKSAKYAFTPNGSLSVEDMKDRYLDRLKEEGFTVKIKSGKTTIYLKNKKLATVTVKDGALSFDLVPDK